ncbi:CpsD/CapB family tyrosine-protein kinase [Nitrolancea hollandica]|uniref:Capsular exopolysaccharide family n=1 Tax=Nitrolancea hollandica Lb TaxID=1129897 RepID=I4EHU4_9BACT|nr:CpsD/CapB family tyrosine-protein kinase [Nitrolancea hollandica]CCF84256.1 Capsular exopolysaccharide family [Nitrolancea hollandica Lb]
MSQIRNLPRSQQQTGAIDLTVVTSPASATAEAYRSLRSTVKFAGGEPPVRSLLVADAGTGGQHSAVAANLAAALALGGDNVVLVDADLRQPRLHEFFRRGNETGLTEWLADPDTVRPLPLSESGVSNLRLLSAGRGRETGGIAPGDLLNGDAFTQLLTLLREEATFTIIDAPALPEVGDALAIAARVDAALLLIRSGKTRRPAAQQAKDALDRVGTRILGAVLTDVGGRKLFGR